MEETLFLTINIIDRFLARQTVVRKKLQLVGVIALLLACKYEEVSVSVVEDLILISDQAYTREEVLEMVEEVGSYFFVCDYPMKSFLTITLSYAVETDWSNSEICFVV